MSADQSRRDFLRTGAAAGMALAMGPAALGHAPAGSDGRADLILTHGRVAVDGRSFAEALAVKNGRFLAVGDEKDILRHRGDKTQVIDAGGRTVIPGLNDSHTHLIRGGLSYNQELRWDGVRSLADAMELLKRQVLRTPPPQWVRVVGGFCEFQFKERRLPTLLELNVVAPDTPVFVLHLYDRALLNRAALHAVGYTKDTPAPPGGMIEREKNGEPTGLLVAKPNATLLYKTLALGPKLSPDDQLNSTRHFMRELNRLGVTSCVDAGGGFQNYPEDYQIIEKLHREGLLAVRIAYNLFTQRPKREHEDFATWTKALRPGQGDSFYRANGAGEMLVYSASDFEDFREPRPELPGEMDAELTRVVRLLAEHRWPFRLHATYDETITRALDVFEAVNREVPLRGIPWFFDHAETITDRNIERVQALGGGLAIQHRMAFQGECFVQRYGALAAERTPPVRRMLEMGVPVGAGTDATRVASYNPWVSLYWLTTGKTVGGTALYPERNRLSRAEALRLFTSGSAWFSGEQDAKGKIAAGQWGDFVVLSEDYFAVPEERIRGIESMLTVVGGRVVFAQGPFKEHDPPLPPISPSWSPVALSGEAQRASAARSAAALAGPSCCSSVSGLSDDRPALREDGDYFGPCPCTVF